MAEVEQKIAKLRRFTARFPALADVPALMVRGEPKSLRQALAMLERREDVEAVLRALETFGLNSEEEIWRMAEEYYRRLAELPPPRPRILVLQPPELTIEQALEQVRRRTDVGRTLLEAYASLLNELRARYGR